MNWNAVLQSVLTAVFLAVIMAVVKLFWDVVQLKAQVEPVITWYVRTSMDALKIATNPTSERLTQLADKYIDAVTGKGKISNQEKQELIDGLWDVMNNPRIPEGKRQSASMSLRFIEGREGTLKRSAGNSAG